MPGARCARSRACSVVNTRVSHHGNTGIPRHSPRNGFNGFLRALPGDRAFLPPSLTESPPPTKRQRRGVRTKRLRRPRQRSSSSAPPASTASRPASVTIASRPSGERDGGGYIADLGKTRSGIFLREGLDSKSVICPSGSHPVGAVGVEASGVRG